MATVGIIAAADEAAEFPELERQPSRTAGRALPWIAAVGPGREQVRSQHFIERVDDLRDTQLLDVADRLGELSPEIAKKVAPGELIVGDPVELLFETGGEIVFHIPGEETLQEGREHPSLVFGHEALVLDPHVAAVPEDLQDRSISGRTADTELLHA